MIILFFSPLLNTKITVFFFDPLRDAHPLFGAPNRKRLFKANILKPLAKSL